MYEIWWSKGQGTEIGPKFKSLEDALNYVYSHEGEASFAVRMPDRSWYRNSTGTPVFSRCDPGCH